MNWVVVHAEDEDAHRIVFNLQPPDRLQPAAPRQVEIHDDEVWAIVLETCQSLFRRRRLTDLGFRFDGNEAPETGMNDRMVVNDQNLHAPPATEEA